MRSAQEAGRKQTAGGAEKREESRRRRGGARQMRLTNTRSRCEQLTEGSGGLSEIMGEGDMEHKNNNTNLESF